MNPLVPALALALCLLAALGGVVLMRSVPAGAQPLLEAGRRAAPPRRSLLRQVQAALGRRFGRQALALIRPGRRELTRHRLDAAGHPGGLTLEGYAGVKATSTILFAGGGLLLALVTGSMVLVLALGAFGWLQPDLALAGQAKRRQAQIDRDLPDFLDVLTLTVGAGLGFRSALGRVADALGGPLGQEVRIALAQMGYGAARRSAFEAIRGRNDSESLGSFMTALLQAEELGAPLGETLGGIAEDLRRSFSQRARRDAARAVPRVSLITTTVVVPGVMVLLFVAMYVGSGVDFSSLLG